MPLYDYRCENGHEKNDVIVYSYEKEPEKCEECGGPLERQLCMFARYDFVGVNTASVTPKKYRGMKPQ